MSYIWIAISWSCWPLKVLLQQFTFASTQILSLSVEIYTDSLSIESICRLVFYHLHQGNLMFNVLPKNSEIWNWTADFPTDRWLYYFMSHSQLRQWYSIIKMGKWWTFTIMEETVRLLVFYILSVLSLLHFSTFTSTVYISLILPPLFYVLKILSYLKKPLPPLTWQTFCPADTKSIFVWVCFSHLPPVHVCMCVPLKLEYTQWMCKPARPWFSEACW